jgi:hypothetical protein
MHFSDMSPMVTYLIGGRSNLVILDRSCFRYGCLNTSFFIFMCCLVAAMLCELVLAIRQFSYQIDRQSVVDVVTGLWTVRSGVRFLAGVTDFIFSRNVHTGSVAYIASCSFGVGAVFLGQAAGREADQSPPSSAEVNNKWRYTSTLPRCLYGL